MSIYNKYLGMALGLAALSQEDKCFSAGYSLDKPYFNPNYRITIVEDEIFRDFDTVFEIYGKENGSIK